MRYDPSPIEQAYRTGKAAGDDDAARAQYQRGIDLARGVLARTPDQPDALLWLSANLAGEALTHGKLRALRVIIQGELETDRILNELMGKDASARFRFIMERADEAEELDV